MSLFTTIYHENVHLKTVMFCRSAQNDIFNSFKNFAMDKSKHITMFKTGLDTFQSKLHNQIFVGESKLKTTKRLVMVSALQLLHPHNGHSTTITMNSTFAGLIDTIN